MAEKTVTHLEEKAQFSDLKLYSLLELTTAINSNESVQQLLKIYEFILHEQLGLTRFLLIVNHNDWEIMLKVGYKGRLKELNIDKDLMRFEDITVIESSHIAALNDFDVIIPVSHKKQKLAFLLVGDIVDNTLRLNETVNNMNFLQTLTNIMVVAIENKRMANEGVKQERIKKELEVASEMQKLLFPSDLPTNRQMDVAAKYKARHEVGGDYYDFFPISDDEYILCIGDVSGKGIAAALLMANFQATLRTICLYQRFPLDYLVSELNKVVFKNAKGEKFITFFIAEYNVKTRELTYINAGHNHPFITNGRKHTFLDKGTIGLGMFSELPFVEYDTIKLPKNTTLVLYTDGVVELENSEGEAFEIERVIKVIHSFYPLKTDDLNNLVFSKLEEWKGDAKYADDTAIFTCRFF
jgi:phosphoserine phosphatase RsbU/P